MRYTAQVYLNVRADGLFFLHGYQGGDPMGTATDLTLVVEGETWQHAAERAWVIANREGADALGHTWPTDVRSMSMGDVAQLTPAGANPVTRWAAVAVMGFTPVGQPTNVVPLEGTTATSRGGGAQVVQPGEGDE